MNDPTFIIIGAHKAATTSLHYYLKQHPQVYLIPNKGEDILTQRKIKSIEDADKYLEQYKDATNEIALGEVSSVYLHADGVAQRIKHLFPDVKIIAVLRNPADRAYSHACFKKKYSRKELKELQSKLLELTNFIEPGYYYAHLTNYFKLFPREQIKIMLYDELVSRPDYFIKELFTFIGVDPNFEVQRDRIYHKGKLKPNLVTRLTLQLLRSNQQLKHFFQFILKRILPQLKQLIDQIVEPPIPPLSVQARRKLIKIYQNDIVQLQELTGLDCSHWLNV
ncbi:MAG TPA: hypothetical protein DD379_08830 [Cyanobacteria bacterium UBA11162]|nr:hypothetical protein [Cyanobacteria bacterium UBA11162]